jgi:hypothetical protein
MNMKKIFVLVAGLCFSAVAFAAPTNQTLSGWVSDSKCGVKGASASHAECAKKCIAGGEKPVLVTDKDQKVLAIDNPAALKGQEGRRVQVTGSMTDSGALHVDSVKQ